MGFTEWTNVVKAKSLFAGHQQPHLPADLGFYDLRHNETRAAQAQLASEYGISAFCYWHYWFNSRRILERPFDEVLASGEPDFPFMLAWANENWTRTWDGGNEKQLLTQNYSDEDDIQHMVWLCKAFADSRYLRIDGRPVYAVYRASLLPNIMNTTTTWRRVAREQGIGEIYLCRIDSHDLYRPDPALQGFDAAIEFQPDVVRFGEQIRPPKIGRAIRRVFRPNSVYRIHDVRMYSELVENSILARTNFFRYRGVTPSWDNSARRHAGARIFKGATPALYERWLTNVVQNFQPRTPDENLVFINAWNEWAEGNHLEPDTLYGRGYLEATRRALSWPGTVETERQINDVHVSEGL